jgi:MFS family permease
MTEYIQSVSIRGDESDNPSTTIEKLDAECQQEALGEDQQTTKQHKSHYPCLYSGSGIISDPFIVEFLPSSLHNPINFTPFKKWLIVAITTFSVLAITLTSSAYSGCAEEIIAEFHTSSELFSLGISLFVLGFAIGPALWAPLSELYGQRILFITTHAFVVAFVGASAGLKNMASFLVFRFLAGTFGASPLTNTGGVIADLFSPSQRGLAMSIFATATFMGPVLGPALGGFITITVGWRWVQGVCCIFLGLCGSLVWFFRLRRMDWFC